MDEDPVGEPEFVKATRASYDAVAVDYAAKFRDELAQSPLDRAVLGVFAERLVAGGGGRVAEVGSGPGRVTAYLHGLGVDVYGVDLSPEMVALARAEHPALHYEVGSMLGLDAPDHSLAGIAAFYSLIHIPDEFVPLALGEFSRVLQPGGLLLVAFQVGTAPRVIAEGLGHQISLTNYRRTSEHVCRLLASAGFAVDARVLREPAGEETTQHCYLLAVLEAIEGPRVDPGLKLAIPPGVDG